MFKHFKKSKKSKISHLVLKKYKVFKYRFRNHMDTYDEAHYSLMDSIDEIYSNNKFTYEDYVLRRIDLTIKKSSIKEAIITIAVSALVSIFITSTFNQVEKIKQGENNPLIQSLFILFICFMFIIFLYLISKKIYEFILVSYQDYFNTKDYELSIIENKLNELDEKHRQEKKKKQGVKNDTNCTAI
ncbi:MAG: hypothetical protein SOT80_09995 [Candidatus Pseudoruminococcus sp.]|nr:hypothetical protein [Ruminococcus sp.]MDY2783709.1 hypothetical protein [Candidatus Pseudoruminococcus sp.]